MEIWIKKTQNNQTVELEVSVRYGYSSKFYNLGVSHAASILAAMAGVGITNSEACTWKT